MIDAEQVLKDVEDHLLPRLGLDPIERALYYHLLRHTRLVGKEEGLFGVLPLAKAIGVSEFASRTRIRSLHEKGCIVIRDRTRSGHVIKLLLPQEMDGLIPESQPARVNPETVDFFSNRAYVPALLSRQNGRCFYCLRELRPDACSLDHVVPQLARTDHSHRNVVASCHDCNAFKQGREAGDFLRELYRKGVLSHADLEGRLTVLEQLQRGELVPEI